MTTNSKYSKKAQDLAYAWVSTQYPLDAIAEMHLNLVKKVRELEHEKREALREAKWGSRLCEKIIANIWSKK